MRNRIILSVLALCLAGLLAFSPVYPVVAAQLEKPEPVSVPDEEPQFHTFVAADTVEVAKATPWQIRRTLNDIYSDVEVSQIFDAKAEDLEKLFHLKDELTGEYYIKYSSGRFGVADIHIVKPKDGKLQDVITALENRREDRIREFESYRIHNSDGICRDAQIYEIGGYVVMVLMEDEEAALEEIRATLEPDSLDPAQETAAG